MTKKTYEKIRTYFETHPLQKKGLLGLNSWITRVVYASFLGVLLFLGISSQYRQIWQVGLTCGVSFVVVSAFRGWLNMPRPYEIYEIPPVIPKTTKGKSFPSRHVFSVFVIATAVFSIYPIWGSILLIFGILLAVCRVLGGVHTIWDVIAGAAIGIVSGILGMCLLK